MTKAPCVRNECPRSRTDLKNQLTQRARAFYHSRSGYRALQLGDELKRIVPRRVARRVIEYTPGIGRLGPDHCLGEFGEPRL